MVFRALVLLALTVAAQWSGAQTVTFTVAYEDKAQPPYYMAEGSGVPDELPGVAVEMVQMLEAKIPNLKVRLVRYPWKRCLDQLEKGAVDAIFNASHLKERERIGAYPMKAGAVDPSRRMTTIAYSLYTLPSTRLTWDGARFGNADNAIFGAPLGYSIVKDLREKRVELQETMSSDALLKQLLAGRIHAAVMQDVTADALIANDPARLGIIRKHELPVASKPYYLMLSLAFQARHPELAERIWNEIGIMRETVLPRLAPKYRHG